MKIGVLGSAGKMLDKLIGAGFQLYCYKSGMSLDHPSVTGVASCAEFFEHLEYPRVYVLDLEEGEAIDEMIDHAYQTMEPGDLVIDPSNSYWCDTLKRYRRMKHRSIYFMDVTAIKREDKEIWLLAGDQKGADHVLPVVNQLSTDNRAVYLGDAGFAHYVSMIEEARLAALEEVNNEISLMIEAWPLKRQEEATTEMWPLVQKSQAQRAPWILGDALSLEAPVPVITQALMQKAIEALDLGTGTPVAPKRLSPFQSPDEILGY